MSARSASLRGLAIALVLVLGACVWCHTTEGHQIWGFESVCGNAMCGFEGEGLQIVPGWNPGEHVLHIPAGATATRTLNETIQGFSGASLTLLARCDHGASLTIRFSGVGTTASPGSTWTSVAGGTLPGPTVASACPGSATITQIAVSVSSEGGCDIDDVTLSTLSTTCTQSYFGCPDATPDATPEPMPYFDASADAGPPPALFTPCRTVVDCPGIDLETLCLGTYPAGLCTRGCTVDGACGLGNHCVGFVCLPGCTVGTGASDCTSYGAMCSPLGAGTPQGVCVPSSSDGGADADAAFDAPPE